MVNGKQHSVWFVPTGMKGLPQYVLLNFRLEFPKSDLTIYFPSGISEIFRQMVSTPNLPVLKSCMMLSRSSIIVLCFGRDLFPRVSLHEDLHTNSTHCVQIILKTRFQFPRWVMKKVLFLKVIAIFKLIYLLWLKTKQTLRGFCVTHFTSEARTQSVSRDLCYSLRQSFNASY